MIPTSTSKKTKTKGKTQGGTRARNVWNQDEELLLAECYIQISEDPKRGAGQSKETFWYRVLDVYNLEAERKDWTIRTKNMLTGKWIPMKKEVGKWNSLVNEKSAMNGENDQDFKTRVHYLYKSVSGIEFKHMKAWSFLKDKHKWKNPESTLALKSSSDYGGETRAFWTRCFVTA